MNKVSHFGSFSLKDLKKIVSIMRISVFLLSVAILQVVGAESYSQSTVVSVKANQIGLTELFSMIEKQSEFLFFYVDADVKDIAVSVRAKNKRIDEILNQALEHTNLMYVISGRNINILPQNSNSSSTQQPQKIRISGRVTDSLGESIIGANVIEKGTINGVITDIDGTFHFEVAPNAILYISFIGYMNQEIPVADRRNFNILLKENIQTLDEVVVIGYGTVKRANLGGAVATTDAKTFQSRPIQNAAGALQGEIPGLTIIRPGGEPGSEATIQIRDVSSINGGTPLVLIDGAEGNMNMINAADIESVSVLKDGSAAIYGARAADGVILITTKNARRNQKLSITFNSNYAIKKPALLRKPSSLYQHAVMGLEIADGSFPIEYTQEELALIAEGSEKVIPAGTKWGRWGNLYPKFYKNQDWNKMIIGNGHLQNYNISFSGGAEKYSYLISLGYQDEKGLPKYGIDSNKRYFVRAKSNIQIVKNLDYDINLSYEAGSRNYSSAINEGQTIWNLIYKTRNWTPLRNPAGRFYTFEGFDNPAQVLEEGGLSNRTAGNFTVNQQLRWQIIEGLNLIGKAVVRKSDEDKNIIQKEIYNYNWDNVNHRIARKPNSAERNYAKTLYKNFTVYAEYKKTLADMHDLGMMAGAANESADYDFFSAKRLNFDQQELISLPLGSSDNQEATGRGYAWTINSFFGRINYAFANRYLIEGTLRADGSSRYHPDYRWGYFPGVNVTWRLSEEQFIKQLNIFDDFKIRASYGEMGNQLGNSYYDYRELIGVSTAYYPFGNGLKGQMYSSKNLVSTSRTWETIETVNLGLDFGLLNSRLYGSFDYFLKENKNMLILKSYPKMLGIDPTSTNDGRLKINGWEVAIGWRDQIGDFNYSIKGSLSDAENKMVERNGDELIGLGLNQSPKGYPLNSYFGYEFDGIIRNEQDLADYKARFPKGGLRNDLSVGDAKYKDLDGDGKFTVLGSEEGQGDVKYLGDGNPRYTFGLNMNAEFRGFDIGVFFQGVGNRTMFLEGEGRMPFAQPWFQSAEYWYGKTWTPERTDARYPAITSYDKRYYNYEYSTNTKHNVAYLRLKNLQIGYTIPKQYTQKLLLEKVRIYFSGEDLFEIHNTPGGWDPEELGVFEYPLVENRSIDAYPFARSYSFGLNIVF
jgi:TonB-linked SusC/RagA family outer membrane protein